MLEDLWGQNVSWVTGLPNMGGGGGAPHVPYHSCQVSRIQLETPAFDSVYKQ